MKCRHFWLMTASGLVSLKRAAAILLLVAATSANAHPNGELDAVRAAVLSWANALVSHDAASLAPYLHADFRAIGGASGEVYLENIGNPRFLVTRVDMRFARYERLDEGFRVGPVVLESARGLNRTAVALQLVGPSWQILALHAEPSLPTEILDDLPPSVRRHAVPLHIRDADTGAPMTSRIHVVDAATSRYYPPPGHRRHVPTAWREDVGGDVVVDGRTFAYVPGDLTLDLPAGSYEIEVASGLEYESVRVAFEVAATGASVPALTIELRRWAHMARRGWYSGDTHVHFLDPQSGRLELEGEDLNVLNILATRWRELWTNVEHFTGAPSALSGPLRWLYVGEEARHGFLGHTILLGLKELVHPLSWGPPGARGDGVLGGYDYPAMAAVADQAHAQGGLVSWAHMPQPMGELAVDVALGKIDSVDLLTFGDAFAPSASPTATSVWYRLLNCGFRLPATGGTDKMWATQRVGAVRTYVRVPAPLTYERWLAGIRAGRTLVTSGPLLELTALGRESGDVLTLTAGAKLDVEARVRSLQPVEWLEIVAGGRVVARLENPQGERQLELTVVVPIEQGTWIAARAHGGARVAGQNGPQQAHTSPIYVEVDGRPTRSRADAEVLAGWCDDAIDWAKTRALFHSEAQRREVVALFEQAKQVYVAQME
jgi:hypothetical protein